MSTKAFIGGVVFGALIVLTLAAKNAQTSNWEYNVVTTNIYNNWDGHYSKALNKVAIDGWEVVTSERRISDEPEQTVVEIVLRRLKK